jgi:ankyrin repeat protein
MPASDCGSIFDKDFDSEYYHELFSWTLDAAYAEPSFQRNSETGRQLSVASSDYFGKESLPYANSMHTLVRHLPWFQFHDLVGRYGQFRTTQKLLYLVFKLLTLLKGLNKRNIAFSSALHSVEVSSTSPPRHLDAFEMCEALEMRYKLVSELVNARLNDTIQISVDKLTNQLLQLIPERNCGEIKMKVQHTFNRMNKFPAFQIFEWALYLSSNNLLSEDKTDNLLVWIIEERLLGPLISLLEQKLPTIVAFAARILESAVRIGKPAVLSQLLESSIDSSVCRGPRGAMLLHERLARYRCQRLYKKDTESETVFDLVRILLLNGAHPDLSMSYCDGTSALLYAARNRKFEMVELFSKFGTNVPNTALACAVERDDMTSINMLLDLGADVDKSHIGEVSTLEWAAMRSSSIYEILLERSSLSEEVVHVAGVLHAAKQSTLSSYIKQSDGFLSYTIRKYMEFALVQAVRYHDGTDENCGYKITETLLQFGVNPNTPTQTREHPLKIASRALSMGKVKLLVSAGASVNTPGVLCAASRNFKLLKFLVDSGADLDTFGSEALYGAVKYNRLKCVALLLRLGVNVNSRYLGRTPLEMAAERGSIEIAQMLVQHGAIMNTLSGLNYEYTALEWAAGFGSYDLVEYLLDMGADGNLAPRKFGGMTALGAAAHRYSGEEKNRIIKLLLSRGTVFNRRPEEIGATTVTTALHGLIFTGEDELCCLAVSEGVDVNYMTSGKEGRTPIQLAAEKGRLEIVKLLLKHGAQVNAPPAPRFGRTALQAAACCEFPALDIIQILLEEGAEVNAEPAMEGGVTAIQGAAIQGHVNVALALLKAHARVNDPPAIKDGRTAVEGAAEHGRLDMVKLLLEAGAVGDPDTGFEKAVKAAEKYGHFAVADMLREHMQRQAA